MQTVQSFGLDFIIAVSAFFGGLVRVVNDAMNGATLSWLMMLGRVLVAVFSGWVLAKTMVGIGANEDLTIASASLAGWLGIQAMELVTDFVKRKLSS